MSFFSSVGKNIILPQDVLIQSKETNQIEGAINATIGQAMINNKVMKLNIIDEIVNKISNKSYTAYAPTPGDEEIRNLWKNKILTENKNLNEKYLSLPIVITGITQGIDISANLFSEKNDALLLPNLYWQNYKQIYNIKLENNIYTYNQFEKNNFSLNNFKTSLNKITENKITILLNFPNNPTGYTPTFEELNEITNIVDDFSKQNKNKKIIILCDDAYFGLFFEKNNANSTINTVEKLVENENCLIIKIDGITKEYYAWGLRVGFITYYTKNEDFRNELMKKTQGFIRSSTSSGSSIAQIITKELLKNEKTILEKNSNDFIIKKRYEELKKYIEKEKLFNFTEILPFNSGYFFTIKLPEKINAHDFRKKLLNKYKIGVYSMDDNHIRIAFACIDVEKIEYIIKNIKKCLKEY